MIHFVLLLQLAVLLSGGTATAQHDHHPVPVSEASKINVEQLVFIRPITAETRSNLPQIHGARQCGGTFPGTTTAYRVQNCAGNETCAPLAEHPHFSELDIIPGRDSTGLGLRLKVYNEQGIPTVVLERPIENSSVDGGQRYRVYAIGSSPNALKGHVITVQLIFYDVESNEELTCVESDYKVM